MSFDAVCRIERGLITLSQSLWNRAVSFDSIEASADVVSTLSQSLWNRAVSFDVCSSASKLMNISVSIPLEQGSVFRRNRQLSIDLTLSQSLWNRAVSFDEEGELKLIALPCLNPFGTGQCLSTDKGERVFPSLQKSQSLWNRAVSFDSNSKLN